VRRELVIRLLLAAMAISVAGCGTSTSTPSVASTPPATEVASAEPVSTPSAPASTPAATPTASISASDSYPFLAGYQGHFTGSWNNATFASTGSMTWDIAADPSARTITITVDVGGKFFGGPGAPPETVLLTHLAQGAIAGQSPAFGNISGTITPDGALSITLTNIPGGLISKVDITGTFTGGNAISMSYSVTFAAGGTAAGTVKLNRA
jgi:hypothetical protein